MRQAQSTTTYRILQPGDHIYCQRNGGLYDHHGIYVGDDMVIHLRGAAKKLAAPSLCPKCENKRVIKINGEIAKECIDCFLKEAREKLKIYDYGVPLDDFIRNKRGTCSIRPSKPPHEVIKTANDFLEHDGFGRYNIFANNCEDFAVYCKTGNALSHQILGRIGGLAVAGPLGVFAGAGVAVAYGMAKVVIVAKRRRKKKDQVIISDGDESDESDESVEGDESDESTD